MPRFKQHQSIAITALIVTVLSLTGLLIAQLSAEDSTHWGAIRWTLALLAVASNIVAGLAVWRLPRLIRTAVGKIIKALEDPEADVAAEPADRDLPALSQLTDAAARFANAQRTKPVSTEQLQQVLSNMQEAIFVTDTAGIIQHVNGATEALVGLPAQEIVLQPIDAWLSTADNKTIASTTVARPTEAQLRTGDHGCLFVSYLVSKLNEGSDDEKLIFAAQNIDARKKAEQRIRYLARTDSLTKIANRMQFQHYLQQCLARAKRANHHVALMYLDIDRFKDINDTFGHSAGDTALEIFSQRLVEMLPESATPGRLAGDEFGVLVVGMQPVEDLTERLGALADDMLAAVGQPFNVHNEEVFMTASLGVAIYPQDGDNVIDLIRNADAALYQAKKAGGNCYEFYSPDMNVEAVERIMIKSKLRRAFENDELRLHYQPKYGIRSGRIEGAEALIRWDQPDHGLLFPSDFIPLAEETNLIVQVGDWVLEKVCADYRRWQQTIPSPCRVSLNLSLRQLQQRRFLEKVRETFESYDISPTCLELEITETTLMEDTNQTIRILDELYGMGLHLAIDDFGTGYSSLSALQQFPINTLKIDQSFVKDVAIDRDNASIVRTIIQMGHSLGLEVVAEGVEFEDQLAFLKAENCDFAQGHLFGDPMTGEEFCQVLAADGEGTGKYRALFG